MLWLIIILFFVINTLFSYATFKNGDEFYNKRMQDRKVHPKVFDIGHKYLPDYTDNPYLLGILNSMIILAPFIIQYGLGYNILDDFIYYFLIIYLIRMIMINSTILPKQKTCNSEFNLMSIFNGHCYDKIFSGHFASAFLLVLIVYKKNIITNIPILAIYSTIIALLILVTRSHYTIDIVVALVVVMFVYFNVPNLINENSVH